MNPSDFTEKETEFCAHSRATGELQNHSLEGSSSALTAHPKGTARSPAPRQVHAHPGLECLWNLSQWWQDPNNEPVFVFFISLPFPTPFFFNENPPSPSLTKSCILICYQLLPESLGLAFLRGREYS